MSRRPPQPPPTRAFRPVPKPAAACPSVPPVSALVYPAAPGRPRRRWCCDPLPLFETLGIFYHLALGILALLEVTQSTAKLSLDMWTGLVTAAIVLLGLWLVAYIISVIWYPPRTSNRRLHFLPMLRYLFTDIFISGVPALLVWLFRNCWNASQLSAWDHRYDDILPSSLDYRVFVHWQLIMFYILVSLTYQVNNWLESTYRHCHKHVPDHPVDSAQEYQDEVELPNFLNNVPSRA